MRELERELNEALAGFHREIDQLVEAGINPSNNTYMLGKLRRLKPGEEIVFYRGPAFDLISTHPPAYHSMMMHLRDVAKSLEAVGAIAIQISKITAPLDVRYDHRQEFEYKARGLARGA